MKELLIILLSFVTISINATNYYVSSSGSDAANGTSTATAWQTLTKVNNVWAAGTFIPGDNIYFKRGDTFTGTLTAGESGTLANRITVSAYGSGADPIINGFTTISGWTNYGGGIYSKVISYNNTPNVVTLDGVNKPKGRWPNTGYYNIDSGEGTGSITATELSGYNWTGAEVVTKPNESFMAVGSVSGHSGSTIAVDIGFVNNAGFFIQDHIGTLTSLGEWYFNSGTFYMYFGAVDPTTKTVKVATEGSLIVLTGRNYITIDNLNIIGGFDGVYSLGNSSYVTIQNCDIQFMGDFGIKFGKKEIDDQGGSNITVNNCTISDCNNQGIEIGYWREYPNSIITNNTLTNIGTIPGMGRSRYEAYTGIRIWSDDGLIQYNSLTNIGYHGIAFCGDNTQVLNNYVNTFVFVKGDGGGIYTVIQNDTPRSGQEIRDNIVLNAIGSPDGQQYNGGDIIYGAEGIYLDDGAEDIIIDGNTVAYCLSNGIFLHNAHEVTVTNNLCYSNGVGSPPDGAAFKIAHEEDSYPNDNIRNIILTGNKLISVSTQYSENEGGWCFAIRTPHDDFNSMFTSLDYNYYSRPLSPTGDQTGDIAKLWYDGYNTRFRSFSEWKTEISTPATADANSHDSNTEPVTASSIDNIHLIYNDTTAVGVTKTWTLSTTMYDVAGTAYSTSVTLDPWESLVLIGDGTVIEEGEEEPVIPPVTLGVGITKHQGKFGKYFGKFITIQ